MIYENDNLKKVQSILLTIMDYIHELCVEHNLTYYLIGGSALGAIRHKGFIPWDMDIDIGMPRDDYEKFREICMNEKQEHIHYYDYRNTKNYFMPHATVGCDNVFVILSPDYYKTPKREAVLVDIFPLDNAPDDEQKRIKQARRLKRLTKLLSRKECVLYKRNTFMEIATKKIIQYSLLLYPLAIMEKKHDSVMKMYSHENTQCICSMASQYAYSKQCMNKEIYGTPKLADFEGRKYYVPSKTDEYLSRLYGNNYMELPPIEKRYRSYEYVAGIEIL